VVFRGRLGQPICEVMIRDPLFWEKHARAVEVNCGRTHYFERYYPRLREILKNHSQGGRLLDLNLEVIQWLAGELAVTTPMVRSSALNIDGKRSPRLVSLCKELGATDYVSPRSGNYLLDDLGLFEERDLKVWFQNYEHPVYEQRFPPFVPYASVLDLLFNHGPESGEIMRSGRRQVLAPEEIRTFASKVETLR
jgi:hypothetical protein